MAYIQLKINTQADNAEAIGEMLTANGAHAVTFIDAKDTPMYEPKPGEVMLWPDTQVIGLFPASMNMAAVTQRLSRARLLGPDFAHVIEQLEDKDWEREWMDNFHPIKFGKRLWVCPSWRAVPEPEAVNVILDPGLAFGTGTHPTTALCLRWLDSIDVAGKTVLDFGCGSGILGVAALKLGAEQLVAIDIDPQALQATMQNAQRNNVQDKVNVYLPQDAPTFQTDVVCANILAAPLRELFPVIADYCRTQGKIVLSGLLNEQAEEIANIYRERFEIVDISHEGEWSKVSGVKL